MIFFSGRLGSSELLDESELLMNRTPSPKRKRLSPKSQQPRAKSQEPKSPEAFFTKC
jgi:hypothetical protein